MKTLLVPKIPVLLAPLCFALGVAGDDVSFHPKAGSELAKKLDVDLDLELKNLSIKVNGESESPEDLGSDNHLVVKMQVGVTDKYVDVKDGKPLDLLRTFDALSLDARDGEEKHEVEGFDAIQGKTVRFKWNEESKAYDKSFHETKGDDETIADLNEDMDLRVLLPEKKVSDGDTWDVSADRLASLFLPGGLVGKPKSGDEAETFKAVQEGLKEKLEPALKDFKVHCKYKGMHDDGGAKLGEIHITFDGKAKLDLSELVTKLATMGDNEGEKPEFQTQFDLGLKGEGTLTWDEAAGHVHAFEMQADITASFETHVKMDVDGEHFEEAMKGDVGGQAKWSLALAK
jgi:hypothetical protein